MLFPRPQFTIWRLMTGVAVLAAASRFGESVVRHPSPRTYVPTLMILYLIWAFCDCLRTICIGRVLSRPRMRLAVTGLVLLAVAAAAAENRWADFRGKSRLHDRQEVLCRLISEGEYGQIILCCEGGCVVYQVPQADTQEELAEMLRLADRHAHLAMYYRSRW
jgi:hypothetical protein